MGLKINGSNIKTIKVNGSEIFLGKLNGYIIFSKQNTPETSTMGSEWLDYGNPHFDGDSRMYDSLDTWIYNTSGTAINGVYLDLVTVKPCEFKMTANYRSYKGGPTKYCVFILDSNNNDAIVNRYDYEFDNNGTLTTRELTVNLHRDKNYKVVIGSDKNFEFGVKITQISLTELQSN